MDTTEPIDPGAKVNPATGMYGCSLYPIYPEPQSPADAEPFDLDALTSAGRKIADVEEIGYLNVREYVASVETLIGEVRRLRSGQRTATTAEEIDALAVRTIVRDFCDYYKPRYTR